MTIAPRLAQANGRLKAGKVGVTIEVRGDRLCLRATFPPKPDSTKTIPHQQRLTLSYHANPAGLKLAEQEARRVGALLESGSFQWADFITVKAPQNTCADWVERFERDYFSRRQRNPKSETTWRYDYQKVFSELPPDAPLTLDLLDQTIRAKEPDTRTRKRFVDVLTRLGEFAGLEPNFKALRGGYSQKSVTPRNLPDDATIAHWRNLIPNLEWRRVYSLIAVYGLRPHEVFKSNLNRFPLLEVEDDTKTGERLVYPLYPEWADEWDLLGPLPTVSGPNNTALGSRVTHSFTRYQIPFPPYNLRHRWAVRSIEFGMEVSLAAAQMGHTVKVHCDIYHAWITEDVHDRAYQVLLANPNRPKPPTTLA